MHLHDFRRLTSLQQMQLVADRAEWLGENEGKNSSCMYCLLSEFYVEVLFDRYPIPGIRVRAFAAEDPPFEKLLETLPVDPVALLRSAAYVRRRAMIGSSSPY
jgi:hypothetical protein